MNFLPPGSVRTGPPVNLCADLTSGSPKNSKHLIWNLSVRPLSITAYPLQRCREAPESSWHGQKVGFNRQVARSSRGWDTPTNRSHSQSLRVVNQLTSPCFRLSRVSLLVFDPYMKAETGPSKSVWLQKIHDRFFKPLLIIRTSDVTMRRWWSHNLLVFLRCWFELWEMIWASINRVFTVRTCSKKTWSVFYEVSQKHVVKPEMTITVKSWGFWDGLLSHWCDDAAL